MPEPMSDERLAQLRSGNEPLGDHLSGLTADEVGELLAEVDRLRAQIGTPADPDDVFEPGHTYRSENGYFEFHCERRIGEYAFGIETVLKDWPVRPGARFYRWASIGPSVGYIDVTGDPSSKPGD